MEWLPMLQNFGFPAVVLGAVGVALWRAMCWMAEFFERIYTSVLVPAYQKHFTFLDEATHAQRETANTMLAMRNDLNEVRTDINEVLSHIHGTRQT